jgi:hypothetical protein
MKPEALSAKLPDSPVVHQIRRITRIRRIPYNSRVFRSPKDRDIYGLQILLVWRHSRIHSGHIVILQAIQ